MTPEQEVKMKKALGDGSDWPEFTDDAEVNYEIDRRISGLDKEFDHMPPWDEASLAEKALYLEEIQMHKNRQKEL